MIRGAYIMVDPQGRFFDSTRGAHHYSRPILKVGMDAAFAEVDFDPTKFHDRDGDADYRPSPVPAAARHRQAAGGVMPGLPERIVVLMHTAPPTTKEHVMRTPTPTTLGHTGPTPRDLAGRPAAAAAPARAATSARPRPVGVVWSWSTSTTSPA